MKTEMVINAQLPGKTKSICQTRRQLTSACNVAGPIVIAGEKGTGKDHAARLIHQLTLGGDSLFYKVDLSDPRSIREMAIFLEKETGITFYGDKLEEACPAGRSLVESLTSRSDDGLRLIMSLTIPPVEESQDIAIPSWIGEDFFYFRMPSLRERIEDVAILIDHFCRSDGSSSISLLPGDLLFLHTHSWPGNLTELKGWVSKKCIPLSRGGGTSIPLKKASLGKILDKEVDLWVEAMISGSKRVTGILGKITDKVEKIVIQAVLSRTGGNQVESSRLLGINRNTLARKIKRHGLDTGRRRRVKRP